MTSDNVPRLHPASRSEHLLSHLAAVERDVWTRGGVHAHRRRREAVAAAVSGGCEMLAVADVLGVSVADIRTWLRND